MFVPLRLDLALGFAQNAGREQDSTALFLSSASNPQSLAAAAQT
jgi:hypothetical protein